VFSNGELARWASWKVEFSQFNPGTYFFLKKKKILKQFMKK